MSKLKEFRELEQALKIQQQKLESLATDQQLSKDFEFEKKLLALLRRYSLNLEDLHDMYPPASLLREQPARYTGSRQKAASRPHKRG